VPTLQELQSIGIVAGLVISGAGFFLNVYVTWRGILSRRVANYQEVIKSHRDLWKLTLTGGSYERIFATDVDLAAAPLTEAERTFVRLMFLHSTTAYELAKRGDILKIEQFKQDIDDVLSHPIPRAFWRESKHYFNRNFVRFVDRSPKPLFPFLYKRPRPAELPPSRQRWTILVLSAFKERVVVPLSRHGDLLMFPPEREFRATRAFVEDNKIDAILCFGYNKLLMPEVLSTTTAINVHCGLLPLDRGPNPHLWSTLRGTNRGVSIHFIDDGVDTGDIIAQRQLPMPGEDVTFGQSFDHIVGDACSLLSETWPHVRNNDYIRRRQREGGSCHSLNDQKPLDDMWSDEYTTLPIDQFRREALSRLEAAGIVLK
jgi:hypothetical protein